MRLQGTWVRALRAFVESEEDISQLLEVFAKDTSLRESPILIHAPNGLQDTMLKVLRKEGIIALRDRTSSQAMQSVDLKERKKTPEVQIFWGHLRGGREIEAEGDVVVVGNVNPDAYIHACGNVLIFGEVHGVVHAGIPDRYDVGVVAFRIEPQQLGIADMVSPSPERVFPHGPRKKAAGSKFEVAYFNEKTGRIEITTLETFLRGENP